MEIALSVVAMALAFGAGFAVGRSGRVSVPPVASIGCSECDGDGAVECEDCEGDGTSRSFGCDCGTCDGEGFVDCGSCGVRAIPAAPPEERR